MRWEISYMSSPERSDLKNWAMLPACFGMAVRCRLWLLRGRPVSAA